MSILACSEHTNDWIADQWWFWVLIFLGSVVFGVLGQLLINRIHRRWPPRG